MTTGIGYHKGYDVYMGFTKWKIAKACVERPERFTTYKDATDYIDEFLLKKGIDISKFISHADTIKPMEMKRIFLTTVGHKQIEKNVILSSLFYIPHGDYLLLVPFLFMRESKMIKTGVCLFRFIKENKLKNIQEIFKKCVTILNGKITKNDITIYDCKSIDWEKILNMKIWKNYIKIKEGCPLDN